jgi:hypothetical protein
MMSRLQSLAEAASVLARGAFDELDLELDPHVSLVAIPLVNASARPLVVHTGSDRDDDGALEAALERLLPAGRGHDAPAGMDRDADDADGHFDVVARAAAAADGARGGLTFVSSGRRLGPHVVHVLLRVHRATHDSLHALKRGRSANGLPLARSLLDATIRETLVAAAAAVADAACGAGPVTMFRSADEVVRAAGRVLLRTPAIVAGNAAGADGFFQTCHRLSTMHYEGRAGSGQMIVAEARHPNVLAEITLRDRIDLRDHRAVRKILELTGSGLAVLSDSSHVHGLGRVLGAYERASESLFEVWFRSHAAWELAHAGGVLMTVTDGYPRLPRGALDEDEFRRLLGEVFEHAHAVRFERLSQLAMQAALQRRGTTVVITGEAASEAARLGGQALGLEPVALTPDRVERLTSIDGAVLIDLEGNCHAVGVILDGRASRRGDPARGARFNSAVRYVDASDAPCVAIVVSEGGGTDLIRPFSK